MHVRAFRLQDAAALAAIFHASVDEIGSKDYSSQQVSAWSPSVLSPKEFLERVSDGRDVFVATSDNDEPIAFIELETDGHIDSFYCHPDFAGMGVGAVLYEHLESVACARGIERLYVEASEAAKRFFSRRGFSVECRRDFTLRGVAIHNYRMTKPLTG